jgi:hypothetical protein
MKQNTMLMYVALGFFALTVVEYVISLYIPLMKQFVIVVTGIIGSLLLIYWTIWIAILATKENHKEVQNGK